MANESTVNIRTNQLRSLLKDAAMSQREFAREIDLDHRLVRHYCAGNYPIPESIMICAQWFAALRRGGG